MLAKDQVINTYRALNNWRNFRLKLFIEGIIIGILSGLIISFFRWSLHLVETNREHIYTFLKNTDWYWTAFWFIALAVIAFTLDRLTKYEPLAAGSGIPQVKGAILGFIKMAANPLGQTARRYHRHRSRSFPGAGRSFDPARRRNGTGTQPPAETYPARRTLPAYKRRQCRLGGSLQRSVSGRYFCFRRTAPQFFRRRPAASHGCRNDCNGYFTFLLWQRHYF